MEYLDNKLQVKNNFEKKIYPECRIFRHKRTNIFLQKNLMFHFLGSKSFFLFLCVIQTSKFMSIAIAY